MKYIATPNREVKRLSFYLAMEEYVARHLNVDEAFFMWQVNPSVIFGRNQLMENEVNREYTSKHGIELFRRKSGGGCVYADQSNIMFSYITKDFHTGFTFTKYLQQVTFILRKLGVEAVPSGRNDITIDGKKISGNAFYRVKGKSVVHGTMLFDTNLEHLVRSITPNNEKLITKGIESVRSRVTNLKNYLTIDIETFKTFVRTHLCESELMLTPQDITNIETIEQEYLSDTFLYGNNPPYTLIRKGYCDAGEITLKIDLKNNLIRSISATGDYFSIGDIEENIFQQLLHLPFTKEEVGEKLKTINLEEHILKLTNQQFLEILFTQKP